MRLRQLRWPFGLPSKNGRRGEQRRRHRLQGQRHAQLLHHVGLGRVVEVHLHGAGAVHHLRAVGADAAHVVGHQPVAALGHHRHLVVRPFRRGADAHEADAHRVGDRRAPRRDGSAVRPPTSQRSTTSGAPDSSNCPPGSRLMLAPFAGQADDVVALAHRGPAEAGLKRREHGRDRAVAGIGQRRAGVGQPAEFLVLGPDAPVGLRACSRPPCRRRAGRSFRSGRRRTGEWTWVGLRDCSLAGSGQGAERARGVLRRAGKSRGVAERCGVSTWTDRRHEINGWRGLYLLGFAQNLPGLMRASGLRRPRCRASARSGGRPRPGDDAAVRCGRVRAKGCDQGGHVHAGQGGEGVEQRPRPRRHPPGSAEPGRRTASAARCGGRAG